MVDVVNSLFLLERKRGVHKFFVAMKTCSWFSYTLIRFDFLSSENSTVTGVDLSFLKTIYAPFFIFFIVALTYTIVSELCKSTKIYSFFPFSLLLSAVAVGFSLETFALGSGAVVVSSENRGVSMKLSMMVSV